MKEISLTNGGGKVALVDDEDHQFLSERKWRFKRGYASRNQYMEGGRQSEIFMHRLVLGLPKGFPLDVDHIDGNRLNNQKSNLRICTRAQNAQNRKIHKNKLSGYKGVCWDKKKGNWVAQLVFQRKRVYYGRFDSPEDAYKAYCDAAIKWHGEFAKLEKAA